MTILQQIMNAVQTRFQTIIVENNYSSDIGNNVTIQKTTNYSQGEPDGIDLVFEEDDPKFFSESLFDHVIKVKACIYFQDGNDTFINITEANNDVLIAIGKDTKWTVNGTPLAYFTLPGLTVTKLKQDGALIGGSEVNFTIKYKTLPWTS